MKRFLAFLVIVLALFVAMPIAASPPDLPVVVAGITNSPAPSAVLSSAVVNYAVPDRANAEGILFAFSPRFTLADLMCSPFSNTLLMAMKTRVRFDPRNRMGALARDQTTEPV